MNLALSNLQLIYAVCIILAYLAGSISSSILIARALHLPDPRSLGSGNPGATNMLRTGSKKAAALTLIGDLLKGLIPLLIARYFGVELFVLCLMGMAATIGHMFPIYYRFCGGKGVATTLGVLLGINWMLALVWVVTWVSTAKLSGYSSVAALVATALLPIAAYFINLPAAVIYLTGCIAILVIWRHQSNIKNLLSGKETKINAKN
ncbi:MAG: glycerol-3-phosphate 1-O-acyltransferase PlsY [Gammaproteobacteria bacterium]|nr:glycerol-3-phosphate 1-O-acyltransferase PlsY [Gammaproteobacteria bacterium]